MARKRIIITTNNEIYNKLNMLAFSTDVVLKNVQDGHITKILNNINKYSKVLKKEKIGNYTILKKIGPLNFSVYFRNK